MTLQEQYELLEKTIRSYNPSADFPKIRAAYEHAEASHEGQKRKSGEPYIIHPLAVAQIVAEELKLDSESIEAALLAHELVKVKCLENCEYTPKEALEGIAAALEAEEVQVVGNKFILFKVSPEKRKYDLVNLCEIEEKKEKKPAKEAVKGTKKIGSKANKGRAPGKKPASGGFEKSGPEKYGYRISKRKG
jgi:RNA-binding protein YhbY